MKLTNKNRPGNFEIETNLLDLHLTKSKVDELKFRGFIWSMCDVRERYGWSISVEDRLKDTLHINGCYVECIDVTWTGDEEFPSIYNVARVLIDGDVYFIPVRI